MDITLIKNAISHLEKDDQDLIKKAVLDRVKSGSFYEETHLHSREQFRVDNSPKEVVEVYKKMGRNTLFLTQYGVAAMTWDFKEASTKGGLAFIPGLETDYQESAVKVGGLMEEDSSSPASKLILHAVNDDGWRAIGMAISASQTIAGKSLMNDAILQEFFGVGSLGHGNVIATNPGVEGPISQFYRESILIEKAVKKVVETRNKKVGGTVTESHLNKLRDKISELEEISSDLQAQFNDAKKIATKSFNGKVKQLEKIKQKFGETSSDFIDKYLELSEERKIAKQKELLLPSLKEDRDRINRRISALKAELKAFIALDEKNKVYDDEIKEIRSKVTASDQLGVKAKEKMSFFEDLFGKGSFFFEIHNHGTEEQKEILPNLVEMARELSMPLLASNDVHMLNNSEKEILKRQILKTTEFPKNPKWFELSPSEKEKYIKTDEEMKASLSAIFRDDVVEEAMLNTLVLSEICHLDFKVVNHHPKFVDAKGRPSEEVFETLLSEGIKKKFPDGFDDEHQQRLEHEVQVMSSMGYVDYHLIVNDFNQYASEYDAIPFEKIKEAPLDRTELKKWKKDNGFDAPVGLTNGTGRGSAVGSLVCYLLAITHLDPLKYELLFERFLNPERVSMPDIDSDISRTVRPIVIEYVKKKYGEDCVAGIITQNAQAPKGAVRIAAKAYGLYLNRNNYEDNGAKQFLSLADKISKTIPSTPGISFDSKMEEDVPNSLTVKEYLIREFSDNEDALKILDWSYNFEGCFTSYGSHAAGIVITDGTPVSEIVPLRWNDNLGLYTTQCDMVVAEEIGMLKFDMLGLKTVDIINDSLWEANKSGVFMDTNVLPLDDKDVYAHIFATGKTDSIFQFESDGMKQMLKKFQPESFEDLIILVSMFRPGPLQYLDDVIDVKHGRKPLTFLTPELEPILGATYGAITYQEQVMQIFQQLAGYTLGGADLVRRYMSKKKADKLAEEKAAFVNGDSLRGIVGCVANGIDQIAAEKLFDQMTEFAKYAFNKSHAAAYAYNAYITGYLKHHYPAEFMMAAMRWAEKTGSKDPIPGLMAEAKSLGVQVFPPDINHSDVNFSVENGRILFGLGAVASVATFANEIVDERKNGKYISFFDYFSRTRAKKDSTKNLILAGAFDGFHSNRLAMVELVDKVQDLAKKIREKSNSISVFEAMLPFVDDLKTEKELQDRQKELGLKVELKKPTTRKKLAKRISDGYERLTELQAEFDEFKIPVNIHEGLTERMNAERKLIGAYVTAHPMDGYEDPSNLGATVVSEVTEETSLVFGSIVSISLRKRKSDGKPFAFLEIEDRTGSIKVNVFVDAYAKNKNLIKEGSVVLIEGFSKLSDLDEEGNGVFEFIAQKVSVAKRKQHGYLLTVNSLALFHVLEEEFFRKKYESETGVPLQVADGILKELRVMDYKVSDDVAEYKGVVRL